MHANINGNIVPLEPAAAFAIVQGNVEVSREALRVLANKYAVFQKDRGIELKPEDPQLQAIAAMADMMGQRCSLYFQALAEQTIGNAQALEEAGQKEEADHLRATALSTASLALPLFTDCVGFVAMHAGQVGMPDQFVNDFMALLAKASGIETTAPAAANLN